MKWDYDLDEELQEQAYEAWLALRDRARSDVNFFIEFCFNDDQTPGSPAFQQQWFHREWQEIWLTQKISVIHSAAGFGKTDQMIAHLIWRIGNKPDIRIGIVSAKDDKAKDFLDKIKRQIENNERIKAIFPELQPGHPWGRLTIRVLNAGLDTTTNTVHVFGINAFTAGHRFDILVFDDVNNDKNTHTHEQRERINHCVSTIGVSRLTTNGQMMILANVWHKDDLANTFARRPGVFYKCYPGIYPDGTLLWPSFRDEKWMQKMLEYMGPIAFDRMIKCVLTEESNKIFRSSYIALAKSLGRETKPILSLPRYFDKQGRLLQNVTPAQALTILQKRLRVVVGVDLATARREKQAHNDFTVFFILGIHPNGQRQVLNIRRGRWTMAESVAEMRLIQERYHPEVFIVENNAQQRYWIEFANMCNDFDARIEEYTTGSEKWDPVLGIESMATEFMSGGWIVPDAPRESLSAEELEAQREIDLWCNELEAFTRVGHTADQIMASWFAKIGATRLSGGVTRVVLPGSYKTIDTQPKTWNVIKPAEEAPLRETPGIPKFLTNLLGYSHADARRVLE